ncbi:FixH family protein [Campylobacter sp.]|uniref:FixH family protein n=1 Tax=Campylobacter sp. TaxID=205 RepID=UPI002711C1E6|nr:FixH family protein [Campylobacter sp.]
MQNNTKTFWPYAIVLSIIAIVIACIATIVIALKNPVQMDNFYMDRYQNVDENINEIRDTHKRFETKYAVAFDNPNPRAMEGEFEFKITPKSAELPNFKTQILLTKPETNEFNEELSLAQQKEVLKTAKVKLAKEGRWQILLKINDGEDTGFYKFDINATK